MKFITIQRANGPLIPVLFAGDISHVDVATIFSADRYAAVSAGFVEFRADGGVRTHDRSVSLNLAPREEDAALISTFYRVTLGTVGVVVPTPAPAPYTPPVFCPSCPAAQS